MQLSYVELDNFCKTVTLNGEENESLITINAIKGNVEKFALVEK
jgi:hypothetical protein